MVASVQKLDKSLTIRIPEQMAAELQVGEGSRVEISAQQGRLIISPARKSYTLEQLLAQITPDNLHGETETGPAVGNEVV